LLYEIILRPSRTNQRHCLIQQATISGLTATQKNNVTSTQTSDKTNISVYPNPAKSHSILVFTATGRYAVEISDMTGKILQTKSGTAAKAVTSIDLNVSSYVPGIYLVTVVDSKQRRSIKLNKEN
jgi:hypothetical protein